MWYREGHDSGYGITNDCVLSGGAAVTVLRDNLCCNERLGGKVSALKPSGGYRTREATFGERIWRRTYHGRKPRQYFFGSSGDGPPPAKNRIGEQTSVSSKKTDWPPSEGNKITSV